MLEICFVLAMCFISFVHSCHYLLYSHGFSFLTEVTNTALGDLILCCCVCVCVCSLFACMCVHLGLCMCACVYDIPIHINLCTHKHNKHSYTYSLSLYHCHTCIIGKHPSCLRYWQTSVTYFLANVSLYFLHQNNVQCLSKITQTQQRILHVTSEAAIYLHIFYNT